MQAGLALTPMLRLVRPLGGGGMGKVWIAWHSGLETEVVVKFLAEHVVDRADAEARFAREAATAAAVKSPHVVQMLDHGFAPDGQRYIAMELLEGRDLAAHLDQHGPMAPNEVAAIVAQIAKALSKAHEAGVIHRDIKPENIFLSDVGGGELFVKVLDFGVAKRAEALASNTTTGQVVGTPFYMSPEQILGEAPVDARTDIWSLGVVAFQALTGRRPFDGVSVGSLALSIHRGAARPSRIDPTIPAAFDEWFARACARRPDDRFATAHEAGRAILAAGGRALSSSSIRVATAPARAVDEPSASSTSTGVAVPFARSGRPRPWLFFTAALAVAALVVLVVFEVTKTAVAPVTTAAIAPPPPALDASLPPEPVSSAPSEPELAVSPALVARPPPIHKPPPRRPARSTDDDIK